MPLKKLNYAEVKLHMIRFTRAGYFRLRIGKADTLYYCVSVLRHCTHGQSTYMVYFVLVSVVASSSSEAMRLLTALSSA